MQIYDVLKINHPDVIVSKIEDFIKNEVFEKFQRRGSVVGISGGIDSAVTAAICTRALGAKNVLGLMMPEKESDPTNLELAKNIAEKFEIEIKTINITPILETIGVYEAKEKIVKNKFPDFNNDCKYRVIIPPQFSSNIGMPFLEILDNRNEKHKLKISSAEFLTLTAASSIKHRIRMTLLYYYSEKNYFCVAGTTNKSEFLQGYFVKYGDGGTDIEPLVGLYKSQIYQLGKFLDIPNEVIENEPSPDIWSLKTNDEEFFYSVPYHLVDLILYARENNMPMQDIQKISNITIEQIEKLIKFQTQKQKKSQHMREIPHGLTKLNSDLE